MWQVDTICVWGILIYRLKAKDNADTCRKVEHVPWREKKCHVTYMHPACRIRASAVCPARTGARGRPQEDRLVQSRRLRSRTSH